MQLQYQQHNIMLYVIAMIAFRTIMTLVDIVVPGSCSVTHIQTPEFTLKCSQFAVHFPGCKTRKKFRMLTRINLGILLGISKTSFRVYSGN